jgi:hypothetical protein
VARGLLRFEGCDGLDLGAAGGLRRRGLPALRQQSIPATLTAIALSSPRRAGNARRRKQRRTRRRRTAPFSGRGCSRDASPMPDYRRNRASVARIPRLRRAGGARRRNARARPTPKPSHPRSGPFANATMPPGDMGCSACADFVRAHLRSPASAGPVLAEDQSASVARVPRLRRAGGARRPKPDLPRCRGPFQPSHGAQRPPTQAATDPTPPPRPLFSHGLVTRWFAYAGLSSQPSKRSPDTPAS